MKKLVLFAVATVMSFGTLTFAKSNDTIPQQKDNLIAQVVEDAYKAISADALDADVKKALVAYTEAYTIKKLEYNDAKKLTKATLEEKASKTEKVVILDESGKEVK